jgi:hypothetical protein
MKKYEQNMQNLWWNHWKAKRVYHEHEGEKCKLKEWETF